MDEEVYCVLVFVFIVILVLQTKQNRRVLIVKEDFGLTDSKWTRKMRVTRKLGGLGNFLCFFGTGFSRTKKLRNIERVVLGIKRRESI